MIYFMVQQQSLDFKYTDAGHPSRLPSSSTPRALPDFWLMLRTTKFHKKRHLAAP